MISLTSEDFPLPETPVTQVKVPSGTDTSRSLRLFSCAPRTVRKFPLPVLRAFGTSIFFLPLKYCPVREAGSSRTSRGVPQATT